MTGVVVIGANRLIVDIVRSVLGDDRRRPPIAVLVEPTGRHWEQLADFDGAKIVILPEATDDAVVAAVHRGANAVIPSGEALDRLHDAVEVVQGGDAQLTPSQARAVVTALRRTELRDHGPRLSAREREILDLISRGHSVKQTAVRLGIAAKTVENLQGRLFRKLEARNRAHAVARAFDLGLLDDPTAGEG